jgi:hypothetical protein
VVLQCRQIKPFNLVTRVRMDRRIEAVHCALEATAKNEAINVPVALQQDQAIKKLVERGAQSRPVWPAQATRDSARLQMQKTLRRCSLSAASHDARTLFACLNCRSLSSHENHCAASERRADEGLTGWLAWPVSARPPSRPLCTNGPRTRSRDTSSQLPEPVHLQWPSCVQLALVAPTSSALQEFVFPSSSFQGLHAASAASVRWRTPANSSEPSKSQNLGQVEEADTSRGMIQVLKSLENVAGACQWRQICRRALCCSTRRCMEPRGPARTRLCHHATLLPPR